MSPEQLQRERLYYIEVNIHNQEIRSKSGQSCSLKVGKQSIWQGTEAGRPAYVKVEPITLFRWVEQREGKKTT